MGKPQDGSITRTISQAPPVQVQGILIPTDPLSLCVPFHYQIAEHQSVRAPASGDVQGLTPDCPYLQREPGPACGGIYKHEFIKE